MPGRQSHYVSRSQSQSLNTSDSDNEYGNVHSQSHNAAPIINYRLLNDRLIDWLIDLLIDRLINSSFDDWLIDQLID